MRGLQKIVYSTHFHLMRACKNLACCGSAWELYKGRLCGSSNNGSFASPIFGYDAVSGGREGAGLQRRGGRRPSSRRFRPTCGRIIGPLHVPRRGGGPAHAGGQEPGRGLDGHRPGKDERGRGFHQRRLPGHRRPERADAIQHAVRGQWPVTRLKQGSTLVEVGGALFELPRLAGMLDFRHA